ncbi:MAG: PDZ domain-containing protein [Leptolyngbya sp. BL-A-14]
MWEQFGKPEVGFTPAQLQQVIEAVAETDLTDFFERCLHGTDDLPFDEYLAPFGLRLLGDSSAEDGVPYLGLTVKAEHGRDVVKFVEVGSPARKAGIDAGDELLAINGLRVSADQLTERLRDFQSGDRLQLSFFHQDELRSSTVTLADPRVTRFQVVPVDRPTREQAQNFLGWLKVPLETIR